MKLDKQKINDILKNDGVIAFVTDTVWGIGCLAESEQAVKKIYEIKHRDEKKPLILMSNSIKNLEKYVKNIPEALVDKHFPGALTLVLKKTDFTPDYITKNLDTVGIRVPNNPVFQAICEDGIVLATTSANISSEPAALTYQEAAQCIGDKVDLIIEDFGYHACGHASTVAGFSEDGIKIFRQGDVII